MPGYDRPHTPGTPATAESYGTGPHNNGGTYYNFNDKEAGAGGAAASSGGKNWFARHKLLTGLIAAVVVVAIALGAGLGAGLGSNSNGDSSNSSQSSSGGSSADKGSNGSNGSSGGSNSNSNTNSNGSGSNSNSNEIKPLATWVMTDPNTKMWGASLGNWLLLERWMNEDWMVQTAGPETWDEWSLIETLGKDKALSVLKEHWDTWVTEAELDTMKDAGFNTIRIPVGYWAFVDAAEGEPYLAKAGQVEQMDKMLKWLHARGMYASIDLHGMPGSQNGDQSSGHNTTGLPQKIGWFSDANQQLSLQTLNATIDWVVNHPYKSVVNSIGIVNEPRPWDSSFSQSQRNSNAQILRNYYETGYQLCKAAGIPALFHHGFYEGQGTPADYWRDFATGKDPNYLGYEDHPYPGWFTANNNSRSYMRDNVCQIVQGAVGYPVPLLVTEWSSINGVGDSSWTEQYTNMQAAGYAWSGGSVFWSFKTIPSDNYVLGIAPELEVMYSALDMIKQNIITKPSDGQTVTEYLSSRNGADTCGQYRSISWTNPSSSGSAYSGRRRTARDEDNVSSSDLLQRRVRRRLSDDE